MRACALSMVMTTAFAAACAHHASIKHTDTNAWRSNAGGMLSGADEERWLALLEHEPGLCGDGATLSVCGMYAKSANGCHLRCKGAGHYAMRLVSDGATDSEVHQSLQRRYRVKQEKFMNGCAPTKSAATAKIEVVIFSDFQCPQCRTAAGMLDQISARYQSALRVVYKYAAISGHTRALPAAYAAEAAHLQGRFWAFHDVLFRNQELLEDQDLIRYAQEAELDVERFNQDRVSDRVAARVNKDISLMEALEVVGTPTLYINGVKFRDPMRSLQEYIREEIGFEKP